MTDELGGDPIMEFGSAGPKSYCYQTMSGKSECKNKGTKSAFEINQVLNCDSMMQHIQQDDIYLVRVKAFSLAWLRLKHFRGCWVVRVLSNECCPRCSFKCCPILSVCRPLLLLINPWVDQVTCSTKNLVSSLNLLLYVLTKICLYLSFSVTLSFLKFIRCCYLPAISSCFNASTHFHVENPSTVTKPCNCRVTSWNIMLQNGL